MVKFEVIDLTGGDDAAAVTVKTAMNGAVEEAEQIFGAD